MARRRASFASLADLRSSASIWRFVAGPVSFGTLHSGHWLANPGLSGFSSNSSPHSTQVLIGKAIVVIL